MTTDAALRLASSHAKKIYRTLDDAAFVAPEERGVVIGEICRDLDALTAALSITSSPQVIDRDGRPIGVDLVIPDELKNVFAFIAGKTDGTLFVVLHRPTTLRLVTSTERGDVEHSPIFIPADVVGKGDLIRLELKDPR